MEKKIGFSRSVLADRKYDVCKENVRIGNTNYLVHLQRILSVDDSNEADMLCVNCFQFIPEDRSVNYMLDLGYDGKYGTYGFAFIKNLFNVLIDMDSIVSSQKDLPMIKEFFKDHFEKSFMISIEERGTKFEDISDVLYALFDYCYEYLVKNGFHVTDIKSK